MSYFVRKAHRFAQDEKGVTSIEYAFMGTLIAIVALQINPEY